VQGKRVGGLLFAQALQRGVGLPESRVHGLGVTRDEASAHALSKEARKQVLKAGGRAIDEQQLAEDYGVERELAGVAIPRLGLRVEKVPVEQFGEPPVEMLLRHALRQAEAQHDFINELLVAL